MSKSTELVAQSNGAVVAADAMLTREQMGILRQTICKDASDQEMAFFSHVCRAKQLDPFSGEIFLVKRDGKPVIQTGIDGFRAQAERSGAYAGSDEPSYEVDEAGKPTKCSVTVYKIVLGARVAFTATIRWDEFYPGDKMGFMWRAKPFHMLGKCAEAQALRKAFPRQLAGVHLPEEMDSAVAAEVSAQAGKATDITEQLKAKAVKPAVVNAEIIDGDPIGERRARALKAFDALGKNSEAVLSFVGLKNVSEITSEHLDGVLTEWYDTLRQAKEEQA